ncbi:MAG: molecular chaperone [Proteobacteria bacterium]|nr:molecular chaperone [Pseudomonadota bacterium]
MKRFWSGVDVAAGDGGWQVRLDGRAIRTVGGRAQVLPSRALADALAGEWAGQGEEIDPAAFVLRDMADYALDVIAPDPAAATAALLAYAETDTLCYRADPDEPLYRRQAEVWEPLLAGAEARWGLAFTRISGVIHRPQPPETLATLGTRLAGLDPFAMAALRNLAGLAASLTLGLLALEPGADHAALWYAANLEEEWQADLWGRETEAETRRERRGAQFLAAARFAALAGAS